MPVRLYLFRLGASLATAVAPIFHAAIGTTEAASGCPTHTSITTRRLGRNASSSPAGRRVGCVVGAAVHVAVASGLVDAAAVADAARAVSVTPCVALRIVRSLGGTT